MYRLVEGERRVLQLEEPSGSSSARGAPPSFTSLLDALNQLTSTRSATFVSMPRTETDPPDVLLHVNECAFALHLSVLRDRCPWFYKKVRQLRHARKTCNGFQLLDDTNLVQRKHMKRHEPATCPLRQTRSRSLGLEYVYCVAHQGPSSRHEAEGERGLSQAYVPALSPRRKRVRTVPCDASRSRRVGRVLSEWSPVALPSVETDFEHQRGILHVKMVDTSIEALVTILEYLYRDHVRLVNEAKALEVVTLGQKLGLHGPLLDKCLVLAIHHVTLATWIETLLLVSMVDNQTERHLLGDYLLACMKTLQPDQYTHVVTEMRWSQFNRLQDPDLFVQIVRGLVKHVRLMEFWQLLRHAVSDWVCRRYQTQDVPSLRTLHHHDAPEWEPYLQREAVELPVNAGDPALVPFCHFGPFELQFQLAASAATRPVSWRIIRSSSRHIATVTPDPFHPHAPEPTFWLRGHVQVTYARAPAQEEANEGVQYVRLQYQHGHGQYSTWSDLELLPPSTFQSVTLRGTFFVWGNPVCSVYHSLLETTLFYSAPHGTPSALAALVIVSEMQRLPFETLELVFRSDRLRLPDGERTLVRCLNQFVDRLRASHEYNVMRLYECVRWCFIPLDDILHTLRWSRRRLELYHVIETGLEDTFRRVKRRRPWGSRKDQDAYMENETNVVDFRMQAGDQHLAPSSASYAPYRY
ncbi:hypothetical protein PsorP6_009358 [Peronosclerospora sorghi]|uniref:Uncharacterized protein n=1 Tax=Peronosclerospora sorghi TaxID=230839 RepID=A0ACC0VX80_9STRA|nr:hypothetical protein PsorP6_009358 [Peronosclerospora sorghi]